MKFITLDCETGGLGTEADLLTAYFGILDQNFDLVEELDLKIRPSSENDFFHISAKALEINKIDLVKHFKEAEEVKTAGSKLFQLLTFHSKAGSEKLIPVGHNVHFDIVKINEKLLNKKTWNQYVGYRKLDTGTIGQFLQLTGKIPMEVTASLSSLMAYFNLQFPGEAHTARADALACALLMKEMIKVK